MLTKNDNNQVIPTKNAVNYIWMGNFKDGKTQTAEQKRWCCQSGPVSLAKLSPETPINMWVPEGIFDETKSMFQAYPSIQVLSVDRMLAGEYGEFQYINKTPKNYEILLMSKDEFDALEEKPVKPVLVKENTGNFLLWGFKDNEWKITPINKEQLRIPANFFEKNKSGVIDVNSEDYRVLRQGHTSLQNNNEINNSIRDTLLVLGDKCSFAAQKDLISFAVIAEYGGHFFDTTTAFFNKPNLSTVEDFKITLSITAEDLEESFRLFKQNRVPSTYNSVWAIGKIDIWAFAAATPNHHLFMDALRLTLELSTMKFLPPSGHAARAFFETLNTLYGYFPEPSRCKEMYWLVNNDDNILIINELNMKKFHTHSWRPAFNQKNYEALLQNSSEQPKTQQHPLEYDAKNAQIVKNDSPPLPLRKRDRESNPLVKESFFVNNTMAPPLPARKRDEQNPGAKETPPKIQKP